MDHSGEDGKESAGEEEEEESSPLHARRNGGGGGGGGGDASAVAFLAAHNHHKHLGKKKSLLPQIELNEYDWRKADASPSGSLRKKFVFTVPGVMKQEQPREYKLKALVVFLFFLIVIYISLTYVFHKQQQLHLIQVEIGERIHFRDDSRLLRLYNSAKLEILSGNLGLSLPSETPYNCLHRESLENKCLEWKNAARLQITHVVGRNQTSNRCFNIVWKSLHKAFELCDCFSMEGHWYGVGETGEHKWPLEMNNISFHPFVTGEVGIHPYGSTVERYWLSSKGAALLVDSAVPLFVSMNQSADGKLCFKSKFEDPYMITDDNLPFLNYTICTGNSMRTLHRFVASTYRHPPSVTPRTNAMIEKIVWTTQRIPSEINQTSLFNFTDDIISSSRELEAAPGIIVVTQGWQLAEGDLLLNDAKFSEGLTKIQELKKNGFFVVFSILPYVSTDSKHYSQGIENGLWILDAKGIVPGLTRWESLRSVALIDFTNNQSVSWFNDQLQELNRSLGIDGFCFMGGESSHLPYKYIVSAPLQNPDKIAMMYAKMAFESELAFFVSTMSDATSHPLHAFVNLSPRTSTWDTVRGLKSVVRSVLTLGLIGYPFVNPGSVGGDHLSDDDDEAPDEELYVRWLQLAVFLPVVQFSVHPNRYGDDVVAHAKALLQLRKATIVPLLQSLAKKSSETGLPMIRPLWWIAPNDTVATCIDSQFMLGDDLMVAPVLDPGVIRQHVYFPRGFWQDAVSKNTFYKGGRWEYHMPVDKWQVLYFNRVNLTQD